MDRPVADDKVIERQSPAPRQSWVDVSRGVGIILVAYGHILRGHFVVDPATWVTSQATLIYAFHMPLFFILSGLFLWSSLSKDDFLQSRWKQLIYPYFLWSLVTVALESALSRYVNSPLDLRDALLIPFVPFEQFWFLYALLVCQLVAFMAYPRKWLLLPIAVVGLVTLSVVGGGWIGIRSFLFLPFVLLGIFGKSAFDRLSHAPPSRQLLVAIGAWAIFAVLWTSGTNGVTLLLGACGSIGTIALAMLAAKSVFLGALGRASLAIYLLHSIFSAGARIVLARLGLPPTSILSVLAALIAGIFIPYIIWEWARRTNRTSVLGLGN